jgi:Mannosyltransferase (PIG-V)
MSLRIAGGELQIAETVTHSALHTPLSAIRAPHAVIRIVVAAFGVRVLSAILALLVNVSFPLHQPEQFTIFGSTSPFWDTFARYDSGHYELIAWKGYTPLTGARSNIAFFPVYPMLMRSVARLFGRQHAAFYISGIAVSWLCFVLAMIALFHLARLDLPEDRALRAVLLTMIFPFSFFFGLVYSESTFLLFAVLAVYFFRTRRWLFGGLCGAVATATRVPGIILLAPLAWLAWQHTEPTRQDRSLAAAGLVLAASGFGAYCFYVYLLTGDPLEWVATLQRWGYHPGGSPWSTPIGLVRRLATEPYLYLTTESMAVYDTLYGVTGILFGLAIPFVWRRFGGAYAIFVLLNLWLPFSSGALEGIGRYCSVLFPCFIWLGSLRSQTVFTALVICFAMFYTLGLALFVTIHPLY